MPSTLYTSCICVLLFEVSGDFRKSAMTCLFIPIKHLTIFSSSKSDSFSSFDIKLITFEFGLLMDSIINLFMCRGRASISSP